MAIETVHERRHGRFQPIHTEVCICNRHECDERFGGFRNDHVGLIEIHLLHGNGSRGLAARKRTEQSPASEKGIKDDRVTDLLLFEKIKLVYMDFWHDASRSHNTLHGPPLVQTVADDVEGIHSCGHFTICNVPHLLSASFFFFYSGSMS